MTTQLIKHETRAHAILAPSSIKMNRACLMSLVPLPKPVPKVESVYALEGTLAHEHLEDVLRNGLDALLDIKDAEMRGHIADLYETILLVKSNIAKWGCEIYTELIEERVTFSEYINGTIDYAILYTAPRASKRIYAIDLKYGRTPVIAKESDQLKTYIEAIRRTYDWQYDQATIAIYQPRTDGPPLDQHIVTAADSKNWTETLEKWEPLAIAVVEGRATATEHYGDHCQFCPRKAICKTYREHTRIPDIIELGSLLPETTLPTKPDIFTDEQLAMILEKEPQITALLKAVRAYCTLRTAQPGGFLDYKLVAGRSSRRWQADDEFVIDGLTELGIAKPTECKLRGITEIEREIGKGKIEHLTIMSEPTPKLVKGSDPRPALDNIKTLGSLISEDET